MFGETEVPLRYELELNEDLSKESQYATVAHEMAHLYCGHLGTPNGQWWPDRRGLSHSAVEFEAESVAYMVCSRLGIDNPSDQYLAGYVSENNEVPLISFGMCYEVSRAYRKYGTGEVKAQKG